MNDAVIHPSSLNDDSPATADVMPEDAGARALGREAAARTIARVLSGVAFGVAVLTLVAWALPVAARAQDAYAMKVNTALALATAAASNWLYLRASPNRSIATGAALVVAGIGLVTLVEYVVGWDLGIDQLLRLERQDGSVPAHPGRMGSNTATALLLLGAAMAVRDHARPLVRRAAEAATLLAATIALLGFVGHVFGVRVLYAVALHTQMAVHTAVALMAVSVAILLAHPERGVVALILSDGTGGFMARRLIPVIVVVPLLIGWLVNAGARAGMFEAALGASVDVVLAILVLLVVVLLSARALNGLDEHKKSAARNIVELNQRLVRHALELEELNRELESFSYSVSHDLRAPIRHIGGFAELLQKRAGPSLDEKSQHYMRTICESASRAGDLIDDLLAFSRMSRAEMTSARVDMDRCVADVWRDLAPDRRNRSVTLEVSALPAVTGDEAMIRLVFHNLLGNAIKYSRPRERAVVEVGASVSDREIAFFVRDNGVGFDMRYVDKLFGVFQRLHGPDAFEGVGIGLANVKRIVQRHGGRVWAEGAVDQGASFFFTLPKG